MQPTIEELRESVSELLRQQERRYACSPKRIPKGRKQRPETRRKLARAQFEHHRALALQTDVSPLRRARLDAGLTLNEAAKRAHVSERTFQRAEVSPASVSAASFARICASFKLPPAELLPLD